MLMSMLSHVLSAWFAFVLPCYGTWKALSHRPVSELELERWSMYWSVVGAFVALEYVAEWLVSRFPFYWEAKTLFLLFLSLPQIHGSTWIYQTYLDPILAKHEADIDAGITTAQANILNFVQARFVKFWDILWRLIPGAGPSSQRAANTPPISGQASSFPPNPFVIAKGMWDVYGPSVIGSFKNAVQSTGLASATAADEGQRPDLPPSASSSHSASANPSFPEPQPY